MFFYHFDLLDNFIKSDFVSSLKKEQENLTSLTSLYHNKKLNLLNITTNIIALIDKIDKKQIEESFYETITSFRKSFEDLEIITQLATKLNEDLKTTLSLYDKNLENNLNEIKANLVEYNKQRDDLFNKILKFEETNISNSNSSYEMFFKISNFKMKKNTVNNNDYTREGKKHAKVDIEIEPQDNNVLIISEKEQKAYLPFKYSEVDAIFKNSANQYFTIQEVVDDLYVIPLSNFKNSSISRFRESFNLIRNKENGSITKAFDLGLELMFKYELNPIIIAACRNLDELDIYLDCLEENELHDFNCFEIKFEVAPQLVKKK